MCRNLAYDCVMKDCIHMDNSPSILRKDGFEFLYDKYKDKIYKDMEQMAKDLGCLEIIINYTLTDYNGDLTMNEWGYGNLDNPASRLRANGYYEAKEKGWL